MTKAEFLKKLRGALRRADSGERGRALTYYSEMIDERMDDGLSEEAAVEAIGGVDAAAEQVISELAEEGKLRKARTGSEIALIAITSIIWLPLAIAALALAIALLSALAALAISIIALTASLALAVPVAVVEIFVVEGAALRIVMAGCGLAAAGGSMLLYKFALLFADKVIKIIAKCAKIVRRQIKI